MQAPKISIGLPVFNGEKYLARSFRCLLCQDYENLELIVSDNASTDATESICREFAAKDPRVRYHRNEINIGASRNYNRVFQLARGEFFKWASHDDECHPSLLRRCMEVFESAKPSVVLVSPKAEIIDEFGRVLQLSCDRVSSPSQRPFRRLARVVWSSCYCNALWGVIRTDALRRTRLMGCFEADHVLLGELALAGELIEIPEVLYQLRCHPGNAISTNHAARELLVWHDPARADERLVLPHWEQVYVEYFKGIHHAALAVPEKLCCYGTVLMVGYWRRLLRWSGSFRHRYGLHRNAPDSA